MSVSLSVCRNRSTLTLKNLFLFICLASFSLITDRSKERSAFKEERLYQKDRGLWTQRLIGTIICLQFLLISEIRNDESRRRENHRRWRLPFEFKAQISLHLDGQCGRCLDWGAENLPEKLLGWY